VKRILLILGLLACSNVGTALAQSTYGSIIGAVKDSSGANVPDATVKLTNTDENTSREVKTSNTGDWNC